MKASLAAASAAVLTLVLAPAAGAHLVAKPKSSALEHRKDAQEENLAHARYVARHGRGSHVRWHRVATRWIARELAETRRALEPRAVVGWPWIAVADCETGDSDGRPPYSATWDYNGSSGFDGGIQFLPSTWRSAAMLYDPSGRLLARYPFAYLAPAVVQVAVADRWRRATSWAQWPACSAKIGLR